MYLRETRRKNKDGSVVSYLQLAHNERHPDSGSPVAKVIHNFGRADQVDREALARLVRSISRFLEPAEAVTALSGSEARSSRRLPVGASMQLSSSGSASPSSPSAAWSRLRSSRR